MRRIVMASLTLVPIIGGVIGVGLHQPGDVEASGHSATRTFASPWTVSGDHVEVTIAAQDFGAFAQVIETLPEGFRFVGSTLPAYAVDTDGNTITFTLLGEEQFTYTVEAPRVEGTYSFSGLVLDQHKVEQHIGGDTSLRVGSAPIPTPTSTPTPQPPATATPGPTFTPTPRATPARLVEVLGNEGGEPIWVWGLLVVVLVLVTGAVVYARRRRV